ncbi:jumonji domain containing 8 [Capsaspora owczarzaki ATCC 30864]|uniref:Jumonji domain containing 8 n=1 Tax=Capsaspora owczarzaki (strain ATCC 30864) TaxID=595528 RepID=A0A0D2X4Z4_CAPO3|nr:jumonji domain containing 8 [Capsaspora owczarzaki ATCC 30864]KJE96914.1 jumonji domain containing 8 [Capsaspora owczarzaki ATCC 30864]|eukprot:XP_004343886.2 jumonji domain containing 8 [Capsaspora owczarzaki ATCC 30864]
MRGAGVARGGRVTAGAGAALLVVLLVLLVPAGATPTTDNHALDACAARTSADDDRDACAGAASCYMAALPTQTATPQQPTPSSPDTDRNAAAAAAAATAEQQEQENAATWRSGPPGFDGELAACNIARVDAGQITRAQFLSIYHEKTPVILTNLETNTRFRELTERQALVESHGDRTVTLSSANTYSYDKRKISFKTYVDTMLGEQSRTMLGNETFYMFGDHDWADWQDLFQFYVEPPFTPDGMLSALSFGVAGPLSGVPMHHHGCGFSESIHGRKRWFLYPPHTVPNFHPDQTTLRWVLDVYPQLKASGDPDLYECVVHPNEAIYFPSNWWHATFNLDECVFMSTFLAF